jgi:hypothetical protein
VLISWPFSIIRSIAFSNSSSFFSCIYCFERFDLHLISFNFFLSSSTIWLSSLCKLFSELFSPLSLFISCWVSDYSYKYEFIWGSIFLDSLLFFFVGFLVCWIYPFLAYKSIFVCFSISSSIKLTSLSCF